MKNVLSISLILLFLCSCSTFDSGDDLKTEAEEVLPSSTWYESSGTEGYDTWIFDSDGSGTIRQHNLPCGSEPVNSLAMEYEIMDGPELRVNIDLTGGTETDIYDIQSVSEEEVVLLNQQDDQISNLIRNCEDL